MMNRLVDGNCTSLEDFGANVVNPHCFIIGSNEVRALKTPCSDISTLEREGEIEGRSSINGRLIELGVNIEWKYWLNNVPLSELDCAQKESR